MSLHTAGAERVPMLAAEDGRLNDAVADRAHKIGVGRIDKLGHIVAHRLMRSAGHHTREATTYNAGQDKTDDVRQSAPGTSAGGYGH